MVLQRLLLLIYLFCFLQLMSSSTAFGQTKKDCQAKCGNVSIPYPFGITPGGKDDRRGAGGCSIHGVGYGYNIYCNISYSPPKPFIGIGNLEVLDISETEIRIKNLAASICYNSLGEFEENVPTVSTSLFGTPFTFSDTKNRLFGIGCGHSGVYSGYDLLKKEYNSTCNSICNKIGEVKEGSCDGLGCCQFSIAKGLKEIETSFSWDVNPKGDTSFLSYNPCSSTFVADYEQFRFNSSDLLATPRGSDIPIVLDWAIGNKTCEEAKKDVENFACQVNTKCTNLNNKVGYRCICYNGYMGNPYLSHIEGGGCTKISAQIFPTIAVALGISLGLLVLFASCWLYYLFWKRKKLIRQREQFYQQNGGLLLKQQLVLNEGGVETSKIFTEKELRVATNNYDESLVLGRGGYGTVYKGTLSDGRVVAIKKSKIADPNQNKQFINEVAILTKIHHRNVVKLLGCCLETEVPLLCYEYISNGTLFQHIHSNSDAPSISWGNRLRIAVEIANALAYLHSAADIPIIHRDVKSANILLDEHYTAKIADFGASRLIPSDKKELATVVLGTKGYLDPEYFNTSQLTEKSDVYSFGGVLVELLTAKKPIYSEGSGDSGPHRNLAAHFILLLEEDNLFELVEDRVVNEGPLEQIVAVAEVARRCLKLKGAERPTMRQVTTELESLRGVESLKTHECLITSTAADDPETYSFGTVTTGSMNIPR
ncbi:wall-associated receptor kinase 3-like [Papaver somniferum]|uniref:wall-associated receptor kinase 3-like n=1 Tax=Papaver somniferum TaxID=3469 RepID=UPI000E6F9A74|nr:wall-associated receptor kinase 3-like [Papaver somniferum]